MLNAVLAATFVSLISLVGVFLVLRIRDLQKYIFYFISLAAGTFLGDVFLHILPEAIESSDSIELVFATVLLGIVVIFVLEKLLHWHSHPHSDEKIDRSLATKITIGDLIHNFWDGAAIAASFSISTELGVATTIAIILHEIPQEIADITILIASGVSKWWAVLINLATALAAIIGVFVFSILPNREAIEPLALAITAGIFLHIAISDLLPHMHATSRRKNMLQLGIFLCGIAVMWMLTFLE